MKTGAEQTQSRVCTRCVMDTTDPDIRFDENGVCNHCVHYKVLFEKKHAAGEYSQACLEKIISRIKESGKTKDYDCVVGLSGGVDSSFVAYQARRLGLRPLAVHFDNGWNSETAVRNIENIVGKLELDFFTYVIDWEEFKDLQRSFFKASVIDIEMLTDHAITAAMFNIAKEHGIRYVLSGNNLATESGMPRSWIWRKQDLTNIRAVQDRFGTKEIRRFPVLGIWRWIAICGGFGHRHVELLNHMDYKKNKAMSVLEKEVGWRYYGGKHYESVFTKFYQAYILPEKFGIDKRKAHLSSLIRNGEVTRDQALEALQTPLYGPDELRNDKLYVLKKLGFSEKEFDEIMKTPPRPHDYYASDEKIYRMLRRARSIIGK